jgi:hypothetical protein
VVTRFGLSVSQPRRYVTVLRSQPGLAAPQSCQLIGPGVLAVFGRLNAIVCCNAAVVDGLGAVVGSPSASRSGPGSFIRRILAVGRRAVACGSVEIARRVVTRLGLSVSEASRDVAVLSSEPGLPAPHSCQLVGSGILAILGGLCAVFGCNLAVVNSLGTVVGSPSLPQGGSGTFACRLLTLARLPVPGGAVEITRRVITGLGLSITLLGLSITHVRSQVAVPPLCVALACGRKGVFTLSRVITVLIVARHVEVSSSVI